jgi:2-keto-4-pentenoate hydratase/2-oxohepta-3-ene-1,7-dioic acid hydratase in catechol pathway
MKLAAYSTGKWRYVGIVDPEGSSIQPFDVSANDAARGILCIIERMAAGRVLPPLGLKVPISDVRIRAPLPRPVRNIFCIGKNYRDHAQEFAKSGYDRALRRVLCPIIRSFSPSFRSR